MSVGTKERTEKKCPVCEEIKSLELFGKNKARHDGYDGYCKKCSYHKRMERLKNNPNARRKHEEASKKYREKNPEKYKETHKKYRESHKQEIAEKRKSKERKIYNKEYMKQRRKDPIIKMRHNVSRQVIHGLKRSFGSKHGQPVFDALNYTPEQLKEHLEKQFDDKMNWYNYGSYWHIDHIIPHSSFNYSSMHDEQFKKCWALENLRPLEAIENIKKGDRLVF